MKPKKKKELKPKIISVGVCKISARHKFDDLVTNWSVLDGLDWLRSTPIANL